MSATTPQDAVQRAVNAITAGDMEAVLACYESDAVFVAQPGKVVQGIEAIREAMAGYLAAKPTLTVDRVRRVIEAGDIALVCGDWTLSGTDPDGSPLELTGTNIDIVRRQADGTWLLAIDNPFGLVEE